MSIINTTVEVRHDKTYLSVDPMYDLGREQVKALIEQLQSDLIVMQKIDDALAPDTEDIPF